MSDFPTTVPSFMTLVDQQDDVLAAHQNVPNDEISAIATLIGALGRSQSWAVDFISAQLNGTPVRIVKKDASTLTAKAGVCWIANAGQTIRLARRNTADVDITASDIDTGGLADDTYYYVYAVADAVGTTMTFKFSTSATTPTGLTNYELVGWFYNESAGSLDVTSGFVGNVKKGLRTAVPNKMEIRQTSDSTNETPTGSFQILGTAGGGKYFQGRFRSSGRPVVLLFTAAPTLASTDTNILFSLQVDGTEVGAGTTYAYGTQTVAIATISELSEGVHTVEVKFKSGTSGSAMHFAVADNSAYPSLVVLEL